ncbi:hypothetical protein A1D31_22520 [Bradyrhizobium liaoningense]|nr:hypothetical protein A1D31_22520 [Bradyrhizobium liaoningense]
MRSAEFEKRHAASAIVSTMLLDVMTALLEGYRRDGRNVGSVFPEWMVAAAIRENDQRGGEPANMTTIAERIHDKRQNVGRWVKPLLRFRVIKQSGRYGLVGNDEYLQARMNAPYWMLVVKAIIKAGKQLEDLYRDDLK